MRISRSGLLGGLLALTVAVACIRLGLWQLERLDQRRAFNAAAESGLELPPIVLDSAGLAQIRIDPTGFIQRRAVAVGRYADGGEIVLRGRSHSGQPGVHLASVLNLSGEREAVVVNRGWVPSPDAMSVDPRRFGEPGVHQVEGVLQLIPHAGPEAAPVPIPVQDTTIVTYHRLDYSTVSELVELPLLPLYLESVPAGDQEPPIPVPLPTLDEGPHLGYAVQWFSFAAIAILGYTTLVWMRLRRPRPTSGARQFRPPPRP